MPLIEHNENRAYRLDKIELEHALQSFLDLPRDFVLDDADIVHEGQTISLTVYFTKPLQH